MPLINFKTNLTSLKYGLDEPGGGWSGQPYIQNPIEGPDTPTATRRFYEINRTSLDFPIRGGAIQALVSGAYSSLSATIDRKRIEAFFKDAPRGTQFIQKQIGLQLTNPRTQVPNTLTFAGSIIGNAVLPVTQTYNPLNTLAQVQVQGTGAHFNRQGVAPTLTETERQTYQYLAGAPQFNTPGTNRLLILKATKLNAPDRFNPSQSDIINTGVDPLTISRLGISPISNQLFNYPGGPGSVYGIGNTRIFRVTNTDATLQLANSTVGFTVGGQATPVGVSKPYSAIALNYQQLASQNTYNSTSPTVVKVQDFRAQTNEGYPVAPYSDYELYNIASPNKGNKWGLGIGNPGAPLKSLGGPDEQLSYLQSKPGGVDILNRKNPFYFDSTTDPWTAGGNDTTDIIKFAFECLSNDNLETPNSAQAQSAALIFRAFLEGTIQDSNRAEYNTFKYLGRGETFRTYQGFDRSISFTFKIFLQTREEMAPLYRKLNQLISQVYPDYSQTYSIMRGSVVRLTIGDYIYRTPGFLENVDVSIDNSNTPWEIVLDELNELDVRQLPHMVTVSCTFRPIMDILPRRQTYLQPFVPLIVNKDNYLNLNPPVNVEVGKQAPVATGTKDPSTNPTVNPNPNSPVTPNKLPKQTSNQIAQKTYFKNNVPQPGGNNRLKAVNPTFIDNTKVVGPTRILNFAQ